MKKILTMAAVALLATSCSNDENNIPAPDNGSKDAPVEIKLTQNVAGLTTKAPVVTGSRVSATVVMTKEASGSSAADWSGFAPKTSNELSASQTFDDDSKRANVSIATFTAGTDEAVTLNPKLYHAASGNSWVAAVAPDGSVPDGTHVNFSTIDGLQDVMYATAVSAGGKNDGSSAALTFGHKTTQLQFAVKYVAQASNGEWTGKSVSVKSLEILNTRLPKAVHFSDGQVDWTDAATYSVPNIVTSGLPADQNVTTTVSPQVMISPSTPVVINVTFLIGSEELKYSNVTIADATPDASGNLAPVAGSSHLITLTLNEPIQAASSETALTVTATVTEWIVGNAGSAEI